MTGKEEVEVLGESGTILWLDDRQQMDGLWERFRHFGQKTALFRRWGMYGNEGGGVD